MTVRAEIRPILAPPREVVITMTVGEAEGLMDSIRFIDKGETDRLWHALKAAGVWPT